MASTKELVSALAQGKAQQLSSLVQGIQSIGGASQAIAALSGASPEAGVSANADPAMADARTMLDLSRKVDKPIVSIVSPECCRRLKTDPLRGHVPLQN